MCFMGPAIMESRHGLVVQGDLAPRRAQAALEMLHLYSPDQLDGHPWVPTRVNIRVTPFRISANPAPPRTFLGR